MKRALALTAAALLLASPIALAQQTPPPGVQTPPPTAQPASPTETPAPTPTTPATPPPATTPAPAAPSSEPQGCRTRQPAGEPCACLSDTTRIGVSTANAAGVNICVRPD